MRPLLTWASLVSAIAVLGCATSADEDPIDGINEPKVTGLDVVGAVTEVVTTNVGRTFPNIQFNVKITLTNLSDSTTNITYRTGCPVRLELHSLDGVKVYDESRRECATGLSTIAVASGGAQSLFSGLRFPTTVLGDSLAPGRYRVVAVFSREDMPLRVEAGTYNIPLCTEGFGCRPVVAARGAEK